MNITVNEMKILELLWETGSITAREIYKISQIRMNWNKSTTYTVLSKCIEKGFIERIGPNFVCKPIVEKEEVQKSKLDDLFGTFFNSSKKDFLRAFSKERSLSDEERNELENLIKKLE